MSRPLPLRRAPLPLLAAVMLTAVVAACGTAGPSASPSASPSSPPATVAPSGSPSEGPSEPPATADPGATVPLLGTRWLLVEGVPGLPAGAVVDAVFEAGGRVAGRGPCNQYFATATGSDGRLTIGPVGATKMSCGPVLDGAERAFFSALGLVATHEIEGSTLRLFDTNGGRLLVFAAEAGGGPGGGPASIVGPTWRVNRVAGEGGALVSILPATTATLVFGADGRFGGTAGCNDFGADYQLDEASGTLSIGMMTMTMMLCEPPALMAQEAGVVSALGIVAAYAIDDGRLTLLDGSGAVLVEADLAPAGA